MRKNFYCLEKTKQNWFVICLPADPQRGILFHYLKEVNCSWSIISIRFIFFLFQHLLRMFKIILSYFSSYLSMHFTPLVSYNLSQFSTSSPNLQVCQSHFALQIICSFITVISKDIWKRWIYERLPCILRRSRISMTL